MKFINTLNWLPLIVGALIGLLPVNKFVNAAAEDDSEEQEVELYSATITALSCALQVKESGRLGDLSICPPAEAIKSGYVAFDVSEQEIYLFSNKSIFQFQLEMGFGGSIDLDGVVTNTEAGFPVLQLKEFTITPKPKPGAFKGCL